MVLNHLPLLAAALLPALLFDALLRRVAPASLAPRWCALFTGIFLVAMLLPLGGVSAAQAVRGLTGDLSVGTMLMMVFYLVRAWGPAGWNRSDAELPFLSAALVALAVVFYPLSLGAGMTDPYAHGYYPTVLSAMLLTFFCWAVLTGWYLTALLMASPLMAFAMGLLESTNLWDYLFDPILVAAAVGVLASRWREVAQAPWRSLFPRRFTVAALILIAVFLAFSVVLARVNPEVFANAFTVEDGFIEWCTSLTLFGAFIFSVRRLAVSHRLFSWRGKFVLALVAMVCLFGAGEEISWGQRVFDIATPEALLERNAQKEMNLHNLTFEWNGEEVKINRLVFGRLLALALLSYLFLLTPLYRRQAGIRRFIDSCAIPMPANHQIIAYLMVVATVELLVESSKRGEMTEFAGSIVFMLNVVFAANRHIYENRTNRSG